MLNITRNHKFTVPLYNGGANESNIILQKEQLLMDVFRKQLDLLSTNKHYPVNNTLEIDLSLDVVVLTQKEYQTLLNQITDVKL